MRSIQGFCDLNIVVKDRSNCPTLKAYNRANLKAILMKLFKLGYRVAAINTELDETIFVTKRDNKARDTNDIVPPPVEGIDSVEGSALKVFNRITVKVSDVHQIYELSQSYNLKKYDIFALIPTTQDIFQNICTSQNVDVISVDSKAHNSIKFNRKMYNLAVERGIYFELTYAPVIDNLKHRENVFTLSHMYRKIGRSRNVFISSCAASVNVLRSPYDVVNLGLLFGLSAEQAKHSITSTCRSLLIRAEGRKCGKRAMYVPNKVVIQHLISKDEHEDSREHLAKKSKLEDVKGLLETAVPMEPFPV